MRIFVCADIHGNLRAFEEALRIYRKHSPCRFLFLGDSIGYGSHPDAVLDRILNLPDASLILGNHEWSLLDRDERRDMNDLAADAIEKTEKILDGRYNTNILRRFDLISVTDEYTAAHASPVIPELWTYVHSSAGAAEIFLEIDFHLCFIGHTHIPVVYNDEGRVEGFVPGEPMSIDPDKRYIINPGSVGQPRDGDHRASFCIYDTGERTLTFHRCDYDVEAEAAEIIEAGLPRFFADRLFSGT